MRNAEGFCVEAECGEPGLMISEIKRDFMYDGYKGNDTLSDKKMLRDVFRKGDKFFNTGDLMVTDSEYFLSFSDRIGDTFRWVRHVFPSFLGSSFCHRTCFS